MKPPSKREEISYGEGLFLVVSPTGAKSWALRYRSLDRPVKLTLGRYVSAADMLPEVASQEPQFRGPLSIAGARFLAQKAKLARDQGVDPATALGGDRKAARPTEFGAAFEKFEKAHIAVHNRTSTGREQRRLYKTKLKPEWKGRALTSIRRRDVIALIDAIREEGAPVSANRTLALARKFFNWCVEQELIEVSPCLNVRAPTPEISRERELSEPEIGLFWEATASLPLTYRAFSRLLLLTGQRRGEVAQMRWSELSEGGEWKLSGSRTKNGKPHVVFLSDAARAELAKLPRLAGDPDYVFSSGRGRGEANTHISGFSKIKTAIDSAMVALNKDRGAAEPLVLHPWRMHDLRRTFAAGMQRLGVEERVIEKIINHSAAKRPGIVGVYQVYDLAAERKAASARWGAHVLAIAERAAS